MGRYLERALEKVILRAAQEFPAVVLTGPRQAGKTTLLRRRFGASHGYACLDLPDVRAAATEDPRGFLASLPPPVILDEIQQAPELLPYIRAWIDDHREQRGRWLLTGSQNLALLDHVGESLAGRAAVLRLLPLSAREAAGRPHQPLCFDTPAGPGPPHGPSHGQLWTWMLRGGYPELATEPDRDLALWHSSYLQTYLERDVRSLRQVGDLTLFQAFLRSLAARSGQLLNLSDISRSLGVAVNTAKAWLSVLEATHQVRILRPYHANLGKRLVKTPKVYFTDTGTLCSLVGLSDPRHAAAGPMAGAIFETAVLAELDRVITHRGQVPRIHFWRTSTGAEVDLLVEQESRLVPIEVKLSSTPRRAMARGIERLRADLGDRVAPGYVVHPGDVSLPLGQGVSAIPFASL